MKHRKRFGRSLTKKSVFACCLGLIVLYINGAYLFVWRETNTLFYNVSKTEQQHSMIPISAASNISNDGNISDRTGLRNSSIASRFETKETNAAHRYPSPSEAAAKAATEAEAKKKTEEEEAAAANAKEEAEAKAAEEAKKKADEEAAAKEKLREQKQSKIDWSSNKEEKAAAAAASKLMFSDSEDEQRIERLAKKKADRAAAKAFDYNKLNIILFYADDWTMNVLGKLNPNVHTPNIDKMAENGMLFTNNCVTTSVCWVSRATLMTGTYYSRHHQSVPHVEKMFDTHNWNETLFPKLKSAGYYTGMFGKWHAPQPDQKMAAAFDERINYYGSHWTNQFSGNGTKEHVTDVNRRHAIDFLRKRPRNKNFALKVSFFATHAEDNNYPSYKPMNWSRSIHYPDNESHENYRTFVPSKTATEQHWKDLPWFFADQNAGRLRWKRRWEPNDWQKSIRDLFAMATEVDWAVGEIIDVLIQQGVYNETLLVFTTDNGDLHGEHGLAEKWYPFEESIKVPLVVQDPRMPSKHRGTINKDWTLNVDLAPFLLGAAGLEAASFMQGRDIADLYLAGESENIDKAPKEDQERHETWEHILRKYASEDAKKPWRDEWFYEWNMGDPITAKGHQQDGFIDAAFALITNEWKYIYWPLKEYEQLFHRSVDIYDEHDIIQNYYLHQIKLNSSAWINEGYRKYMETVTPFNTTPYGDSIQSTKEIYDQMKKRYQELKDHVQLKGGKI